VVGQKRSAFSWRFAVDFAGGELSRLPAGAKPEAIITASRGTLELTSTRPLTSVDGLRAMFDLRPDERSDPITLRLYLADRGRALSETWLYQWEPPPLAERRLY